MGGEEGRKKAEEETEEEGEWNGWSGRKLVWGEKV